MRTKMKNTLADEQIEAAYAQDKPLVASADSIKEIYALGFLRGKIAGMDRGLEIYATPARELVNEVLSETGAHVL